MELLILTFSFPPSSPSQLFPPQIPVGTRCAICDAPVVNSVGSSGGPAGNGVIAFFCRHIIHRTCYESQQRAGERRATNTQQCPRCHLHHGHQPQQSGAGAPVSVTGGAPGSSNYSMSATAASAHTPIPSASSARAAAKVPLPPTPSSARSPAMTNGRSIPQLPQTRSVLPQPSPSTSARTIPLPSPSNVLPVARASSASNGSGRSTLAATSSTPHATPTLHHTSSTPPSHHGQSSMATSHHIKPQPSAFSRASARSSIAK